MNFKRWIWGLFLIWGVNSTQGQTIEVTLEFGRSLYENGTYDGAVYPLERVYFFGSKNHKIESAWLLANTYFRLQAWDQAYYYYDLGFNLLDGDSLAGECQLGKVKSRIHQGRLAEALELLERM